MSPTRLDSMGVAVDPRGVEYPPYIIGDEQRRRWDLSVQWAEKMQETLGGPEPDPAMVIWTTRQIYFGDIPTDPLVETEEAELTDEELDELIESVFDVPGPEVGDERITDILSSLEKAQPPADADDEAHWSYIGQLCDALDEVFGNPDDWPDFGEFEGQVPPDPDAPLHLHEEALAVHAPHIPSVHGKNLHHVPYSASMHPRDRLGKWQLKLNSLRAALHAHALAARMRVASGHAALALRHKTATAHLPGGALHVSHKEGGLKTGSHPVHPEDVKEPFAGVKSEKLRAHAQLQRNRSGARGARQVAKREQTIAAGRAHTAIYNIYTHSSHPVVEKAAKHLEKVGLEDPRHAHRKGSSDAQTVAENVTTAHDLSDMGREAATYVLAHQEEIKRAAKLAGLVVRHVAAQRLQLAHSAEDEAEADEFLALVEMSG